METDAKIVERCLRGERAAFEVLVDRYEKLVYNIAYRTLGNLEDAADVTQTVFVKVFERLDTFDPSRKFFSWIFRISMNESLNLVKRRRREVDLDPEILADDPNPEELAAASEAREILRRALPELHSDLRAVIVLRHFEGMSYREIGEVLGIPEKTVKSRLFSARHALRRSLVRLGVGE
ncbi:MAG: sigma-70 family RNA polymerase sigma factor [Candidatus Eisenbacteria bacterium]